MIRLTAREGGVSGQQCACHTTVQWIMRVGRYLLWTRVRSAVEAQHAPGDIAGEDPTARLSTGSASRAVIVECNTSDSSHETRIVQL